MTFGRAALLIIVLACAAVIAWRHTQASGDSGEWVRSEHGDTQALAQLQKTGADLSKATEVNYYLYFPDSITAERAADSARAATWEAEVRSGRGRTEWLCLATSNVIPDQTTIRAATERFAALTKSLGGRYDGWEAAVTK